jgi:nicotinamide-nucleotide amidase
MWFEKNNTIFVSMPGVPYEMKHIMTVHVLPELRNRFTTQVIVHKNIMTYGTPEARLAEILTEFEVGLPRKIRLAYLPASGIIKLRLTATGDNQPELERIIGEQVGRLYEIIPEYIYGENEESIEAAVGRLLKERHATLCTAESCTGGEIAGMITSVAGSSAYYRGSVVAYANDIKTSLLSVNEEDISIHGAVSREVVSAMARGARRLFSTDFSVATSGIAGPDGGTETKPVGTLWIAVASTNGLMAEREVFGGDRTMNIRRFSLAALNLLRRQISAS